jgi:thymidylate synthase (FAD)
MKVELLAHTPDPEKVVCFSANLCYSKSTLAQTVEKFYEPKARAMLLRLLVEKGHFSPFEHVSFTFGISGVSRVTTHQLVRHRIASYSQQSQRYVELGEKNFDFVEPEAIKRSQLHQAFVDHLEASRRLYRQLMEAGIHQEDARYVLPSAVSSNIIATFNARSLFNFFELRCCYHAQEEIRRLAFRMLALVRQVAPEIFRNCGPTCFRGYCREKDEDCPLYRSRLARPVLKRPEKLV